MGLSHLLTDGKVFLVKHIFVSVFNRRTLTADTIVLDFIADGKIFVVRYLFLLDGL